MRQITTIKEKNCLEHYRSVLHNNHKIMQWFDKDLTDLDVSLVFWAVVQLFKADDTYISIISIKLPMDSLRSLSEKCIQKNSGYNSVLDLY